MLKVLLLEDDAVKADQTVQVLTGTGAVEVENVHVVVDAESARRQLRLIRYELFVLDLSVPEYAGSEADMGAGARLLEDLVERDELLMPAKIVGLTAFEDLAESQQGAFVAYGVLLLHYAIDSEAWRRALQMHVRQIVARANAELGQHEGTKAFVGIVCALEIEMDAVERLKWGWKEKAVAGDPTLYLEGSIERNGQTSVVVAALCPRMGMAAASITATKLISACRPEYLFMCGITAAIRGQAELGDVIAAEQCWDWGMGKWMVRDGLQVFVPGPHVLGLDADLRGHLTRLRRDTSAMHEVRSAFGGPAPRGDPQLIIGPVASGSAVIASQEMTEHVRAYQRKLIGIEMEAYGVYAAADDAVAPRPKVAAIKAVSDFADEHKSDDWQLYAAYASAAVLRILVEKYL
jgi:nucleoside phosphorylase/CheY-like chemotaxis protein